MKTQAAVKSAPKLEVIQADEEIGYLLRVNIQCWGASTSDDELNDELAEKHGSEKTMTSVRKRLLPKGTSLDDCHTEARRLRKYIKDNTLPWRDKGWRFCPVDKFMGVLEKANQIIADFDHKAVIFEKDYPNLKKESIKKNGTLLTKDEFPPDHMIKSKFKITIRPSAVPKGDHLIFKQLDEKVRAQYRKDADDQVKEDLKNAVYDVVHRFRELIKNMIKNMKKYKVTEDGTLGRLYGSLLTNIQELVDLVPSFNVINDPIIDDLAKQIKNELLKYDIDFLREDEATRKEVLKKAEAIVAKMDVYLG